MHENLKVHSLQKVSVNHASVTDKLQTDKHFEIFSYIFVERSMLAINGKHQI